MNARAIPGLITCLALSIPSPASAQDEPPDTGIAPAGEDEETAVEYEPVCEETCLDLLGGGKTRLIVGPALSTAGATGLAVSLGFFFKRLKEDHDQKGNWSNESLEFTLALMIPAFYSAAMLAAGLATTSIGYGMRQEALALEDRTGQPLDVFCYPQWRARYEFGRRHSIVGTIYTVAGLEMFMIGLGSDINTRLNPDHEKSSWAIGIIQAIFGALTVTAGISLIVKGHRMMKQALLEREMVPPAPRILYAFTPTGFYIAW